MSQEERDRTQQVELVIRVGLRDGKRLWDPLYATPGLGARTKINGNIDALIRAATEAALEQEAQMFRWPPQTDEQKKNHGDRLERARAIRDVAEAVQRLKRYER